MESELIWTSIETGIPLKYALTVGADTFKWTLQSSILDLLAQKSDLAAAFFILGRTAAYRRAEVTWEEIIKASEKWTADLKGLKT